MDGISMLQPPGEAWQVGARPLHLLARDCGLGAMGAVRTRPHENLSDFVRPLQSCGQDQGLVSWVQWPRPSGGWRGPGPSQDLIEVQQL